MNLSTYVAGHQAAIGSLVAIESNVLMALNWIVSSFKSGGKILIAGNGGSASDAQHLAGELVGRYKKNRRPLGAVALCADSAILTCIGNDFGYDDIFSRQIQAIGNDTDVFLAFSTSGNSANIVSALETANAMGIRSILFTGRMGGVAVHKADLVLAVDSDKTAYIQEGHLAIYHFICEQVDHAF